MPNEGSLYRVSRGGDPPPLTVGNEGTVVKAVRWQTCKAGDIPSQWTLWFGLHCGGSSFLWQETLLGDMVWFDCLSAVGVNGQTGYQVAALCVDRNEQGVTFWYDVPLTRLRDKQADLRVTIPQRAAAERWFRRLKVLLRGS